MQKKIKIPQTIQLIAQDIQKSGGTTYVVGGYVRDQLMDLESKDIDLEIFGLDKLTIVNILVKYGTLLEEVGVSFTASKLRFVENGQTYDIDVSLPRREKKNGLGHKSFDVEFDPTMTTKEAASRRDFTINSLMYNITTREIVDHFDGLKDIENGMLKHTSEKFAEDPLRVLRGIQFIGRFAGFIMHPVTIDLCKSLLPEFGTISKERLWSEFDKLCTKSVQIDAALDTLYRTNWNNKFCWSINERVIANCQWILNRCKEFQISTELKRMFLLAVFCLNRDRIIYAGFLKQINCPHQLSDKICELVQFAESVQSIMTISISTLRKKFNQLRHVDRHELNMFLKMIKWNDDYYCNRYFTINTFIADEDYKPKINGLDLQSFGYVEGQLLGKELKRLLELQLEHNFSREHLLTLINPL
jgi:tRNA nucleotidyltransferase/poly(A) polymerase